MPPIRRGKLNISQRINGITFFLLVLSVLSLTIGIAARYLYIKVAKPGEVVARDFYFTVDLLGDTNELSDLEKEINLFGGGEKTVTFNVQNFFDELRVNEKDIVYTASVTTDYNAYKGVPELTSSVDDTLPASVKTSDAYTLTLPVGYEQTGVPTKVTVTVRSSKPYVKEMKLHFLLHSTPAPVSYRVEDNAGDPYATLIVMAHETIAKGLIQIDWSQVNQTSNMLQIDTTSPQVIDGMVLAGDNNPSSQNGYLKTVTTTKPLAAGASMQIYFFKSDPTQNYSTD